MSQETLTNDCAAGERVLYMAIELSSKTWKLAFSDAQGKAPRIRTIDARDKAALKNEILLAKKRFHLGNDAPVLSCHEAGRDGFAVHRLLGSMGLQSAMIDPGSIERPRRKRLAKTDRLDVRMLMRKLIQYHGGDQGLWRVCRVPTAEQEDARRPQRERQRLVKERTAHRARLKSLLATEGLVLRLDKSLVTRVAQLTNLAGAPVGQHKIAEIRREYEPGHHSRHPRWNGGTPHSSQGRGGREAPGSSHPPPERRGVKKLGSSPGLVARYLRQQGELGGAEFFLDKLNRFEAQSLVENR